MNVAATFPSVNRGSKRYSRLSDWWKLWASDCPILIYGLKIFLPTNEAPVNLYPPAEERTTKPNKPVILVEGIMWITCAHPLQFWQIYVTTLIRLFQSALAVFQLRWNGLFIIDQKPVYSSRGIIHTDEAFVHCQIPIGYNEENLPYMRWRLYSPFDPYFHLSYVSYI